MESFETDIELLDVFYYDPVQIRHMGFHIVGSTSTRVADPDSRLL